MNGFCFGYGMLNECVFGESVGCDNGFPTLGTDGELLFSISTLGTDVVGVKGLGYGANDGDWVMVLVLKDDSKM